MRTRAKNWSKQKVKDKGPWWKSDIRWGGEVKGTLKEFISAKGIGLNLETQKRGKRIRLRWGSHSTFSPHSLGSRLSFFVGAWRSWWWWLAWQGRRAMDGWCRAFCLFTCITLWQNAWETQTYFSSHELGPGVGLILLPRINYLTKAWYLGPIYEPYSNATHNHHNLIKL